MRHNQRILGVDLGLKRTGLALSDELWLSVRHLEIHKPKSRLEDVQHLVAICEQWSVGVVVIGHALLASEAEGMMAKRAKGFCEVLREELEQRQLPVRVVLLNEWGTSKQAIERLVKRGVSKLKRKHLVDVEAACVLVEEYIQIAKENT